MQILEKSVLEKISAEIKDSNTNELLEGTIKHIFVKLIEYKSLRIPLMPAVSAQILAIIDDSNADMGKIAQIIKHDPMFGAIILKTANSSFYSGSSNVPNIEVAVKRIGLQEIKRLLFIISLSSFVIKTGKYSEIFGDIWAHSIKTALAADELAKYSEVPSSGEYIAGLLHDIGKMFALIALWEVDRYLGSTSAIGTDIAAEIIQVLHIPFGRFAAEKWNLPQYVADSIVSHHDEAGAFKAGRTVFNVYLGNIIVSDDNSDYLKKRTMLENSELMRISGVSLDIIDDLRVRIPALYKKYESV